MAHAATLPSNRAGGAVAWDPPCCFDITTRTLTHPPMSAEQPRRFAFTTGSVKKS
jgi:hypothetical protein